jgi:hypothetical protein
MRGKWLVFETWSAFLLNVREAPGSNFVFHYQLPILMSFTVFTTCSRHMSEGSILKHTMSDLFHINLNSPLITTLPLTPQCITYTTEVIHRAGPFYATGHSLINRINHTTYPELEGSTPYLSCNPLLYTVQEPSAHCLKRIIYMLMKGMVCNDALNLYLRGTQWKPTQIIN